MIDRDYEIEITREKFDLEKILSFQTNNTVQVVRGEDYSYQCHINGKVYAVGFTPMYVLCVGVDYYLNNYGRTDKS